MVKEQSQQIERQSHQIKEQSHQIERLISKDKDQSQQIERQSHQIERLISKDKEQSQQIERLISKDKEQSQQIERQSRQIERLMSKHKEQSEIKREGMSTVQDQSQQIERRELIDQGLPTPFEWKIPDIQGFYLKAQSGPQNLVSEPFYLSRRGYKYLLQIEVASACFLRLSIKVVPGEFDGLLSWPCKEKVRVTVNGLNKLSGIEKNRSNVVFDFGSEPWPRPLHDDHHEYRLICEVRDFRLLFFVHPGLLIRVNRE